MVAQRVEVASCTEVRIRGLLRELRRSLATASAVEVRITASSVVAHIFILGDRILMSPE